MKKFTTVLASVLMIATMAGCSDASAKLTDGKEALVTIGKTTISKQEVYNMLNASNGAQTALEGATKTICAKEIEVTDEMRKKAEESLANYKTIYAEQFKQFLKENNLTEEQYMNQYVIPGLQASKLASNYIEENFDELVKRYNPIKATVLTFEKEEDATKALAELKDGKLTAAEAAKEFNSTTNAAPQIVTMEEKNMDSAALGVIRSIKKDDGWQKIMAANGSAFYVLKVDESDANAMKDEVVTNFTTIPTISNEATVYYFEKYNFHVYDITLYDQIKAMKVDLLVQDKKPEDKKEEKAEETAAPTSAPKESAAPTAAPTATPAPSAEANK